MTICVFDKHVFNKCKSPYRHPPKSAGNQKNPQWSIRHLFPNAGGAGSRACGNRWWVLRYGFQIYFSRNPNQILKTLLFNTRRTEQAHGKRPNWDHGGVVSAASVCLPQRVEQEISMSTSSPSDFSRYPMDLDVVLMTALLLIMILWMMVTVVMRML